MMADRLNSASKHESTANNSDAEDDSILDDGPLEMPEFTCGNPAQKPTKEWGTNLISDLRTQFTFVNTTYLSIHKSIKSQYAALDKKLIKKVNSAAETADRAIAAAEVNSDAILDIRSELREVRQEVKLLKLENERLREQTNKLETYSRKDNIIFYGIYRPQSESISNCAVAVRTFMKEKLNISPNVADNFDFVRCHRLQQYNKKYPPPIIVRFQNYKDRELVWGCLSSIPKKSGSYMSEDYPSGIRYNRRKLYPVFVKARATLGLPKNKITLKNDVLQIENQRYTVDTMDSLPGDLHPISFSRKSNNDVMVAGGIYSDHDPLTNYYKNPFQHKDLVFKSVEHGYVYYKCLTANNNAAAQSVLEVNEPHMAKRIGSIHNLKNLNTKMWNDKKDTIMKELLASKFVRGSKMAEQLLATGSKRLGEAGQDNHFGTGLSINDKNALLPDKWTGQNLLGKMLMNIRDGLQ